MAKINAVVIDTVVIDDSSANDDRRPIRHLVEFDATLDDEHTVHHALNVWSSVLRIDVAQNCEFIAARLIHDADVVGFHRRAADGHVAGWSLVGKDDSDASWKMWEWDHVPDVPYHLNVS